MLKVTVGVGVGKERETVGKKELTYLSQFNDIDNMFILFLLLLSIFLKLHKIAKKWNFKESYFSTIGKQIRSQNFENIKLPGKISKETEDNIVSSKKIYYWLL